MKIKPLADITDPEIWELSENEDIIIIQKDSSQKRVLVNYDSYKALKDAVNQYRQNQLKANDANEFDLNPFLEDLNMIVKNGNFKDITDQSHYFENLVRKIKSIE